MSDEAKIPEEIRKPLRDAISRLWSAVFHYADADEPTQAMKDEAIARDRDLCSLIVRILSAKDAALAAANARAEQAVKDEREACALACEEVDARHLRAARVPDETQAWQHSAMCSGALECRDAIRARTPAAAEETKP